MVRSGGFYTCLYMHRTLGSSLALQKRVQGMMQQDVSLHEGDRARGDAHGMQQCEAVKADIYLEMLRKSCLGSQKYLGGMRLCWELQEILGHLTY